MAESSNDQQATWWEGLWLDWDNTPQVRDRLRAGKALVLPNPILQSDGVVERSVHNCRWNKVVPLPALMRWVAHGSGDASPGIDFIFTEVEKLYKQNNRQVTVSEIHQDAWAIRKLMGLVKAQVTKLNVPKVSWLLWFQSCRPHIIES